MKILFKNAFIFNGKSKDIFLGDLLVKDNLITQMNSKISTKADRVIDCFGKLLMPGFKNAHTHSGLTFARSFADDYLLDDWFTKKINPAENRIQKGDVYVLSKLAFLECLTSGVTSCMEMYVNTDEIKKAAESIGMRTVILAMPCGNMSKEESVKLLTNNNKDNLVTYALGMHAEYTATEEKFSALNEIINKYKLPVFTHCAESKKEVDDCLEKHKMSPLKYLIKRGLFKYGGGIYHGVHLTHDDIIDLKKYHINVCTCPSSNIKFVNGIAPLKELKRNGINIAIGSDSVASNNSIDIFREMYLASVLAKYRENDVKVIDCFSILKMATSNGAKMLGLNDCDTLEVGKKADIVMINFQGPNMLPVNDVINNVVYSGSKLDVCMTMIDGKILYYENNFYINESIEKIYKEATKITNRLLKNL